MDLLTKYEPPSWAEKIQNTPKYKLKVSLFFIINLDLKDLRNALVTNKTDAVRFQRFVNRRRIWESPGHRTIFDVFSLRSHISYRRRPASVYDNIGRCPVGFFRDFTRMKQISTCDDVYVHKDHYTPTWLQRDGLSKKRLSQTLTVIEVKTTFAQDCSNCNSTCYLSSALKRNLHYFIYIHGL